jgi:SAM-dependent methyltransferase
VKLLAIGYELYVALISFFLWLLCKPLLFVATWIFSKPANERLRFHLLSLINQLYFMDRKRILSINETKYDIEQYQDTYDRAGIELYLRHFAASEIFTDKKILDIGCGVGGKDAEILRFSPKAVYGIDLSERNIEAALSLADREGHEKLHFEKKSLYDITDTYDTVVSFTVFEHIDRCQLPCMLSHIARVLSNTGIAIIVFNHYDDKFGMHLKEYIYHPWPQTIFEEDFLFRYWNKKLRSDNRITDRSYFPVEYEHGIESHNADCFMNLNRVSASEFSGMIKYSPLHCLDVDFYNKSPLLRVFPFLPKKYLQGSAVYYLRKEVK